MTNKIIYDIILMTNVKNTIKKGVKMTKEQIIKLKEQRLNTLKTNGKNIESNGVCKKLERELRNLKK